jgi:hypothetical protein
MHATTTPSQPGSDKWIAERKQGIGAKEEKRADDIRLFVEDRDTLLINGTFSATSKTSRVGSRFDTKRFERDQPENYRQYLTPTIGPRRFLLKGEDHGAS